MNILISFIKRFIANESGQLMPMMPIIVMLMMIVLSMIIGLGQKEYVNTKAQVMADAASLAVAATAKPVQTTVMLDGSGQRVRFPDDYKPVYQKGVLVGYALTWDGSFTARAGYVIEPGTAESIAAQAVAMNESGPGSMQGETAQVASVVANALDPHDQQNPVATPAGVQPVAPPPNFLPADPKPSSGPEEVQPITWDVQNTTSGPYRAMEDQVSVTVTEPSVFNWLYDFLGDAKAAFYTSTQSAEASAEKSPADVQYAQEVKFADLNPLGFKY